MLKADKMNLKNTDKMNKKTLHGLEDSMTQYT